MIDCDQSKVAGEILVFTAVGMSLLWIFVIKMFVVPFLIFKFLNPALNSVCLCVCGGSASADSEDSKHTSSSSDPNLNTVNSAQPSRNDLNVQEKLRILARKLFY